jgi:hypothetical protein
MKIVNLKETPHHLDTLARWHQKEWDYFNPDKALAVCIDTFKFVVFL